MTNTATTTPEKAQENVVRYTNPFCKAPKYHLDDCTDPLVSRIKTVEIKDKETINVEPVYEEVDLMAEVRAASSMAGVDYMKKLLASGMARPEDFYDDGKSGIDTTIFPATVHDAAKMAEQGNAELSALAKELGIPEGETVSGSVLEKYLTELVEKKFKEAQASAPKKEGE